MRAVVLDAEGQPRLAAGPREPLRVLACGLCGSDVEKIGAASAGTVLGHEVVALRADGARIALIHHLPCGVCERCRAGHESTCEHFVAPTIVPGGFADEVEAADGVVLPDELGDALGTYLEPLACVLRGAARVPGGVLVVGQGFVGRLFAEVLRARGDDVYATDTRPERARREPDGPVDVAVLCAPAALDAVVPGGTVLVFSPAAPVDLDVVYRNELTLTGSRSATPRYMREALELLPTLDLPEPTVLPLDRFAAGSSSTRSAARSRWSSRRELAHAPGARDVRALRFHGPGDLRLEDVPTPEPGPGDVLVQVEVALTDGTDLKTFRRGHPMLLQELPSPFGHEFCGIDVATGERVVAANSAATEDRGGPLELLNGAYAELLVVPAAIAAVNLLGSAGLESEVAAMVEPLACCLRGVERAGVQPGDRVAILGAGPIGLMLAACVADAGGRPEVVGGRAQRRALVPEFGGVAGDGEGADVVLEAAGTAEAWQRARARPAGGTALYFGGRESGAELRVDAYRLHYEELTLRGSFTTLRATSARRSPSSRAAPILAPADHAPRPARGRPRAAGRPPLDYLKAAVVP